MLPTLFYRALPLCRALLPLRAPREVGCLQMQPMEHIFIACGAAPVQTWHPSGLYNPTHYLLSIQISSHEISSSDTMRIHPLSVQNSYFLIFCVQGMPPDVTLLPGQHTAPGRMQPLEQTWQHQRTAQSNLGTAARNQQTAARNQHREVPWPIAPQPGSKQRPSTSRRAGL